MITTALIHQYVDYDRWASMLFVQRLSAEPPAVLDAPVASSFPSLRSTVLHLRDAINAWYRRLDGLAPQWPAEEGTDLEGLLRHGGLFHAKVKAMDETALSRTVNYTDLRGNAHAQPAWQMIMHACNHATYHRGQLVTIMHALGLKDIPSTDLVKYQRSLPRP